MRGKAEVMQTMTDLIRITPAYAGKSSLEPYRRTAIQDHPRLCGEKLCETDQLAYCRGSPPPMRGKAMPDTVVSYGSRITPAYAGKRPTIQSLHFFHRDHPRLCGEKLSFLPLLRRVSGSPPPMRGKAVQCTHRQAMGWDHPRLCGEKCRVQKYRTFKAGSPPPMRGKVCGKNGGVHGFGITPAYAGKSIIDFAVSTRPEDHPRLCGEKVKLQTLR